MSVSPSTIIQAAVVELIVARSILRTSISALPAPKPVPPVTELAVIVDPVVILPKSIIKLPAPPPSSVTAPFISRFASPVIPVPIITLPA